MSKMAQVGDFCPNEVCLDYGKLQSKWQDKTSSLVRPRPVASGTSARRKV